MRHSDKHRLNYRQIFGSLKGKSTYDALATVRMVYDMARTQEYCLIFIRNDLKCNYDRARLGINAITTRWMGLPKNVIVCHAKVLRNMKHSLRKSFRISLLLHATRPSVNRK